MTATDQAARPVYTDRYRATVLSLLVVAYTFNFIDRTIISTIGQAIKVDLALTDTQLGLLGGIAFAVLYTSLGIPIARVAERKSRVNIISVSIVIWSTFTALCGTAHSFVQLLLFRVGVGVGEAGLSPPAHSLISDYFEPRRRASALSIYALGIPIGTMLGAMAGGWLTQTFNWRVAFVVVGLPGVLIAIAIKLMIREPVRGGAEPLPADRGPALADPAPAAAEAAVDAPPGGWWAREWAELAAVGKVLFGTWPMLNIVLGVTVASFAGYGMSSFAPPYFLRAFALDYAQVGLITGLINGAAAGIGVVLGGFLTDRLASRSRRWYALVPAIGLAVCAPIYAAGYLQSTWQGTVAILLIPGIFVGTYLGPTFGVVQNMFDVRRRATAAALLFFFLNLIALGGGPVFTGWLIDHLAAARLPDFAALCPGGGAADPACKSTLIGATRDGIVVTVMLYFWAALHYFLASIGLTKALDRPRAA